MHLNYDRKDRMSVTLVLDQADLMLAPRTSDTELKIGRDEPAALPELSEEAMFEAAELQRMYELEATPVDVHPSIEEHTPTFEFDLRETLVATACYGMDVACQVIAMTASLLPRRFSGPIVKPLVARICPKNAGSR